MLHVFIAMSLLHLAWMILLVTKAKSRAMVLFGGFAPIPPIVVLMLFNSASLLGMFALTITACICCTFASTRVVALKYFVPSSLFTLAVIYCSLVWINYRRLEAIRATAPMESMAQRVPMPRRTGTIPVVAENLDLLEAKISDAYNNRIGDQIDHDRFAERRAYNLQLMHQQTTQDFINSEGNGFARMPQVAREDWYNSNSPIWQPESIDSNTLSSQFPDKAPVADWTTDLKQMHIDGLVNFINVRGFGYIKDREHVAGFRSHEFSALPKAENLKIKRLDLIGLLMHEKPVAYVSEKLPRMSELVKAPTRGLSDFELAGLEALQKGEDLFVREIDSSIYMVGAIRSVKQCLTCHGGERGDLLGAFSYRLTK